MEVGMMALLAVLVIGSNFAQLYELLRIHRMEQRLIKQRKSKDEGLR